MKFSLPRDTLHRALSAVHRIVPRKPGVPILANVLITAAAGRLVVEATSMDVTGRAGAPAAVAAEGRVTVPAQQLSDLVARLPASAEVLVELVDQPARLIVKAGRSRCTLPTLPAADWPDTDPPGDLPHTGIVPGPALAAAMTTVSHAICDDGTRWYLCGIALRPDRKGGLIVEATNGHVVEHVVIGLAEPDGFAAVGTDAQRVLIVPQDSVAEVCRVAKSAETVTMLTDGHRLRLIAGEVELITKLIDGTWPDIDRIVPRTFGRSARIDREALIESVGRIAVVSDAKFCGARLDFGENVLALAMRNPGANGAPAETEDELEIDFTGEPITIGFSSAYLASVLGGLDCDAVTIDMIDPGSPTLFRPDGDQTGRYAVVLPVTKY